MSLKKNLDIAIYEQLREKIIRGLWLPGQTIAVDELAEEYGVSRTPVLLALRRMEANRMICVTKTGHYITPSYTEKQLRDLIEMRTLLEIQAIQELEAEEISIPISELREIAVKCSAYNSEGDTVRAREADLNFHACLIQATGNIYLTDLYLRIQGQYMVANYLTVHSEEHQRILADDHIKILEALDSGDFTSAKEQMKDHIYYGLLKMLGRIGSR